MANGVVYYQSVTRGVSNPQGQRPVYYLGQVYKIPRGQHGTIQQLEWERSPEELLEEMDLADGTKIGRVPDGVVERFEVYDQESGDVWVMYRVPYGVVEE